MSDQITIHDVAKMAGGSIATVSRFLNGQLNRMSKKTADRIAKIIQETNYVSNASARQLVTRNSGIVAVVAADIDDYFSTEFFKGASSVLEQHHLNAVLFDSNSRLNREKQNLKFINQQTFDGMILQPLTDKSQFVKELVRRPIKTVILDRDLHDDSWDSVQTNNFQAAREASLYFYKNSFTKIIVISEPVAGISTRQERLKGIQTVYPNVQLIEIDNDRPFLKKNYEKVSNLLKKNQVKGEKTLFFFLKERLLLNFFSFFLQEGILRNKDLSITAFSDTQIVKGLLPDFKMIKQDPFLLGATAAEIIANQISDKSATSQGEKFIVPAHFG
ncbi:LacI family DNA-binding transcriptional regulator [Oenococcus oeni]|uniref:LacI family DNA-binding transcriptional regulator n=1 Tax=Oenococcus oeni TaxID=1247 RepID=UPI0010B24576|nr:LacI family DNA-binding transcriptional regulator [Oenococcus oeni]SYW06373.1 Transcriptional regulator, LacI family [Oenococcus oeni]